MLYAISYTVLVFMLLLGMYAPKLGNKPILTGFGALLAGGAYLLTVFFNDQDISIMWTLIKDGVVLVAILGIASSLRDSSTQYGATVVAVALFFTFYFFDFLRFRFDPVVEVESQGEVLVKINEDNYNKIFGGEFRELCNRFGATEPKNGGGRRLLIEKAFPEIQGKSRNGLDDYYVINISNTLGSNKYRLEEFIERLEEIDNIVLYAEKNEAYRIDTVFSQFKGKVQRDRSVVNDPGVDQMWAYNALQMEGLHRYLRDNNIKPTKRTLIAILDTGIEGNHEDIGGNYKSSPYAKNNRDKNGHGTHCAGIACAVTNNGKGIASLNPSSDYVRVTGIKVLSDNGSGSQRSVVQGIIKAADLGADVISLSLGGPSDDRRQKLYEEAVEYARNRGAIVVVAAGNSGLNAKDFTPANVEGVITVTAVDKDINMASFSNSAGDLRMPIAAPGVRIYSTFPGKTKYRTLDGTSMATPYVAGLLGLMRAFKPDLTTQKAFEVITDTGRPTDDTDETGMFIQPGNAIRRLTEPM